MKNKHIIIFVIFFTLFCSRVEAQTVKGTVFEQTPSGERNPLPGVNVFWAGTQIGGATDVNGNFELKNPNNSYNELVVSYIGYKTDTILFEPSVEPLAIVLTVNPTLAEVEIVNKGSGSFISRIDPIHTTVITSTELRKAACCNLSESFETNASVDVNYSDAISGAKQIQLLGLSGIYSQLMTENIPNLRGISTAFGLGLVPGTWMESIQVSKGTSSVVNGYESITGQINVEYKKPDIQEKLFVNLYADLESRYEFNFDAGKILNPKWSTRLLVHGNTNNQKIDHNSDGFLDQPLKSQVNVMNRWQYIGKNMESRFGVQYIADERTGGQWDYQEGMVPSVNNPYGIYVNNNRMNAYVKVGFFLPHHEHASIGTIFSGSYHDLDAIYGLNLYNGIQKSGYANIIYEDELFTHHHKINLGGSYSYDHFDEGLNDSVFTRIERVPGIFAQYTYNVEEKVTLIAGARADFNSIYGTLFTPRVHVRYAPDHHTIFRASAGKGYRSPSTIAENLSVLASSRRIMTETPEIEDAWNYGINVTRYIDILGKELTLNAEVYRTDFLNQLVVDLDASAGEVRFYNLTGKSYSNNYQVEASYELVRGLNFLGAFRISDAFTTTNGQLQRKPLSSRYKGLINISYSTNLNKWQFDFTSQFNGGGRIPSTSSNPEPHAGSDSFDPYTIINCQVTKNFKHWSIYAGAENLNGFTQHHAILEPENPFGPHFDASLIWGPIMGAKYYTGIRISLLR